MSDYSVFVDNPPTSWLDARSYFAAHALATCLRDFSFYDNNGAAVYTTGVDKAVEVADLLIKRLRETPSSFTGGVG